MGLQPAWEPRPLGQLFEYSVDQYPNHTAIECDDVSLTYRELDNKVNQLAHYLVHQKVNKNAKIGILLERSIECYIAILAILKTGAAYIPIEVDYPDERINYIFADLPFHSVITSSSQLLRKNILFPPPIVFDKISDELEQQSCKRPTLPTIDAHQLCYIIYTSGSTGKPKGVEIMHKSACHYIAQASALYEMTPLDKVYQGFSLAFDASLEELWMAFANGATLVACTSKDIRSGLGLVDFLTTNKISVMSTVPTLLSTLEDTTLSSLRLLILGGEICLPQLVQRYASPGLRIMNTYGPTEATVIATYSDCHPEKPITIGKPLPGYSLHILDEHLNPVNDGESGELCIGGMGLARGYVNRPELTAQKFIDHPNQTGTRLYRTGDLASLNTNGEFLFLGRVDDQVKIRGFRVELNEIEAVMTSYDAIHNAVVLLNNEHDNPMLVSWIIIDKTKPFHLQDFKTFLREQLPSYMIPSSIQQMDSFPLLASGKINRKAFATHTPADVIVEYIAPNTPLEKDIARVFSEVLETNLISITADFFYDLGGHSLLAAKVISNLRKNDRLKNISILDLYSHPSIQQLAEKFNDASEHTTANHSHQAKHTPSTLNYVACGIGQLFGALFQYAIQAWQLLLIILCYEWFNLNESLTLHSISIICSLMLGLPLLSLSLIIAAKWLLLGRVKPGEYKLWGWFYFRWWLVDRLHHFIFPPASFIRTPLITFYYRLMGAKIGANCYLGTSSIAVFDTLNIGHHSSIGYEVGLLGYQIEDGLLKIGSINIGDHCFIGARSAIGINTVIEDNAILDNMTLLPTNARAKSNVFLCGSPAREAVLPQDHITNTVQNPINNNSTQKNMLFSILHYIGYIFAGILHFVSYLPGLMLIVYVQQHTHVASMIVTAPIAAALSMGIYYLCIGLYQRLFINKTPSQPYAVKSMQYLRQWIMIKLLDADEVAVLADSLYFPPLLRFLGAHLGKRVEMGETPHMLPHLVTLDEEAFTASGVGIAWPNVYHGMIQYAPVKIGRRAFAGNVSLLPSGYHLGDEGLLGCLTLPPLNHQAAEKNTAWLGSPAMYLPKREVFTQFSEQDTLSPPKKAFFIRLAIEFIRVILPTTYTFIGFLMLAHLCLYLLEHTSVSITFGLLPLMELGIIISLVSTLIALKWMILGKLKPTIKPLWDIFIRKIDLVEFSWSYYINPFLTNIILGTPFMPMLLRCFGAKIGKRTCIYTAAFAEFDMISIGNHVCINPDTLIDTHLYEDRIFTIIND